MSLRPERLRMGLTLMEILTVVTIIGIVMAMAAPRLSKLKDQAQLQGATTRFSRGIITARQVSIQRGRRGYFRHKANQIWVIVDTTGNDSVIVNTPFDLKTEYGVEVTAPEGLATIEYDPRGVSPQAAKQMFHFKHTASGRLDSLCVSKLGNIIATKCP